MASCGGGGGGGGGTSNAAPVLVTAAFVGATTTPAANDTLVLTFSEAVNVVASALLTDADVTLSGGGSLGTVAAAPSQLSSNTLVVTLGSGVTFTPGATTITLRTAGGGTGNDVVTDGTGQLGIAGTAVVIGTSDGVAPTLSNLTVAAIDDALNGTGAAGGTLQIPANGFTLDLDYSDNSAIATAQTTITANVTVATSLGAQLPGTNLVPFLTTLSATNTEASYRVPATMTFPAGAVTFTALVADVSGLASSTLTFPCTVRAFTAALQPFETSANASQVWFLDFTRDIESFSTSAITGGVSVDVTAGANGTPDCEDVLRVLGFTVASPIANVQNGLDSNQVVLARWKQALLDELGTFYSGTNVGFTLTQPGGSFGSSSSVPYANLGFSRIAIAGASDLAGVLGVAIFDPNNTTQNDDTLTDFGGTRLGIFLHTIVDSGFGPPGTSQFRQTYSPFAPSLGGTGIGGDANDDDRLTDTLNDSRADAIDTAIADFARFIAVVTAHECGHSMGLVQNGAMPTGLYGNDSTNFPGSSDGHIRNTALFPAGSTNIMSPSLSYNAATNAATAFNSLNLAYLREQVLYGN
ncbi:MAG: hypothetical protein JNK15_03475 [Planctomycetes bacterium]|nr:hypothetical protein [Planctomycetota bacterium]